MRQGLEQLVKASRKSPGVDELDALGIRYEAIADYGVVTVNEGIHSLMRMDDRLFRLHPVRVGERWYLESDDPDVSRAIREWGEMRERLDAGKVTQVEYDARCDSYTLDKRVG